MIAQFFTFNKKKNSTAYPTDPQIASGIREEITLLDDTSILDPVIRLKLASSPIAYNYCFIQELNRFYFITDWHSMRDMWTAYLEVDVLSTYKATILASTQYVERAAINYDMTIIDDEYGLKMNPSHEHSTTNDPFYSTGELSPASSLIATVQTLGSPSSNTIEAKNGGTNFYLLSRSNYYTLLDYMTNDGANPYFQSQSFDLTASKLIFNPFDYVISIRFYPWGSLGDSGELSYEPIKFGFWEVPSCFGHKLPIPMIAKQTTILFSWHPQAASRGPKMNSDRYTARTLFFEPFGEFKLPCDKLLSAAGMRFKVTVDLLTGIAKLRGRAITSEQADTDLDMIPGDDIISSNTSIAYTVPLVQILPDINKSNFLEAGIAGLATGALETYSSIMSASSKTGASGTRLPTLLPSPHIESWFFLQQDENIIDIGRPVKSRRSINTFAGFVRCSDAELFINGTQTEQDRVIGYLNGGLFIE